MNFPTSGDLAAFSGFLKLRAIEDMIRSRRPDLADRVSGDDGRTLTVDLPPLGIDPRPRVAVAKIRSGNTEHWLISASTGHDLVTSVWDLRTPNEVIADAVAAMWDRCVSGTPVSPWCYGQSERSPIVQLAEALSDGGLDVDAVVSTNRVVPSRHDFGEAHWIDSSLGEALRLELEWGTAAVSLKPTLGWVMDVDSGLAIRRMDLGRSLTGQPSAIPGLAADQIEAVAAAVRGVVEAGPTEPADGCPPVEFLWHERPDIHAAAWWMRELGYVRTEAYRDTIASTAHVEVWSRQTPVAIGDVQRTFARAAVEGKKPLLIATSQFTRSARRWADDANIALFTLWGEDLMLHPASNHAEEHLPRVF